MSKPILYKANETDFSHLGLGVLNDALSCLVTEERNGLFQLELEYPLEGPQFDELKNDRLIKTDASHLLKDQRFKIIRITKPMKGRVTVYANHVSYLAEDLALKPDVTYSGSASNALNKWAGSIVDTHPFTVFSDIQTSGSGKWYLDKVENARRALGGVSGSLLDTYGGEYRFDNYHIGLYAQRGSDSGALIAYGRNLTDLTQEEAIDNTYTSIYPYAVIRDENENEQVLSLPEYFIDSEYVDNFARRKIKKVDFSQEEIDTVEALRSRAIRYLEQNDFGIPQVNLKIQFTDLSKTLDAKNKQILEQIGLCDLVTVYFEKFGIQSKAKIIKTVWNALLERYDSIEAGEARVSLSQSIDATVDGKIEEVNRRVTSVQVAANGKNKVFRGPDEPIGGVKNDLWYKPVGDGEIEMYIHDGTMFRLEKYSGDQLGGTINFANVNGINFNAANIVTGTLRSIAIESVEIYGSYIEGAEIVGGEFFSGNEPNSYTRIRDNYIESRGVHVREWRGESETNEVSIRTQDGQIRARNDDKDWSLYFNDRGITTYSTGDFSGLASGVLDFRSTEYAGSTGVRGLSIYSLGGRIAMETNGSPIFLNPKGGIVRVGDIKDNYYGIAASAFIQSSSQHMKRDIKDLEDDATAFIKKLRVREYKRLTNGEATEYDKWQVGLILEEAPLELADAMGIDIYTAIGYIIKSIQEIAGDVGVLKGAS